MATRVRYGLAVVLIIASVVTLAICLWPRSGNTPVGEVHSADYVFDAGHGYRVRVPTGYLDLEVRPPAAKLSASEIQSDSLEYGEEVVAGDGHRVVALSWSYRSTLTQLAVNRTTPRVELSLNASGRDIDIVSISTTPSASTEQTSAYVVVDGDGTGMTLDVGFDGVVQHVDVDSGDVDRGEAAALYEEEQWVAGPSSCATAPPRRSGFSAEPVECTTGAVVLSPWVAGLGWVEDPESSWAVLPVDTTMYGATYLRGRGYTEYDSTSAQITVRLDGADPVRKQVDTRGDGRYVITSGSYVFEVSEEPSTLTVDRRYQVTQTYGGDDHRTVRLHSETPLSPL